MLKSQVKININVVGINRNGFNGGTSMILMNYIQLYHKEPLIKYLQKTGPNTLMH